VGPGDCSLGEYILKEILRDTEGKASFVAFPIKAWKQVRKQEPQGTPVIPEAL
jgi:hypothetical protein